MIHTFELSRMIGKEQFGTIIDTLKMQSYKPNFWVTNKYSQQGFSLIKLFKIQRKEVKGEVTDESDITHHYMISIIVNTGAMFHGNRHLSNNLLSFTYDFEKAIIYELLDILPCLETYPELRYSNPKEWHNWNIFKVRRIDFVYEIKLHHEQYIKLLDRGYSLTERYYQRNYYDDEDLIKDIADDEPDFDDDICDEESHYASDIKYIYYKGKSLNINIYHKGKEIIKENLVANKDTDYDFLRIEVQVKKNKLNAIVKKFDLNGRELSYLATPTIENYVLSYYVRALTGTGLYVTMDRAKYIIDNSSFRTDKKNKLISVIKAVSKRLGIARLLHVIEDNQITDLGKLATVKKYLKDIQSLGINPVTISARMEKELPKYTLTDKSNNITINEVVLPNIVDLLKIYNNQLLDEQKYGITITDEILAEIDKIQ